MTAPPPGAPRAGAPSAGVARAGVPCAGVPRAGVARAGVARAGVLVMSYGTPAGPEDVEAYYTGIRRGRPPSPEQLADLRRRYDAIGGVSPLAERTAGQVAAIARALEQLAPGRYEVRSGTKHGRPSLEEAVDELAAGAAGELVGVVLAPHYSALSVGEYVERAGRRAAGHGLAARFVKSWHDDPELVALLAERLLAALGKLGVDAAAAAGPGGAAGGGPATVVVFTAHSLPERVLSTGDPYAAQLAETAALVAARAGLDGAGVTWRVGWQSAGRTPEPWIGPDILQVLGDLAAAGTGRVVVCPAGFTADHLEVLYDLDIEAAELAGDLGIAFARTASLDDDPRLAALLARQIHAVAP